jgi:hypothetical protein
MAKSNDGLTETKRLMDALVRMKPKQHDEMKVGKKKKPRKADVLNKRKEKS